MDSSELRMNLAALQRIDPYIKTIVDSSSQVRLNYKIWRNIFIFAMNHLGKKMSLI